MYKNVAPVSLILALLPATTFGQVTFAKDVAPVVFTKCSQCHHPGGSAPFSLLTYREARSHATQIAVVAKTRVMPPWKVDPAGHKFIGLDPLTDSEIAILEKWVADGAREGNPRDLPAAPAADRRLAAWQTGSGGDTASTVRASRRRS